MVWCGSIYYRVYHHLEHIHTHHNQLDQTIITYPSIHPSMHPSTHQSINKSINQSINQSIEQSIHPSIHLSINQSTIHPSMHPSSIHPSMHLSIHPSIHLPMPHHHPYQLHAWTRTHPLNETEQPVEKIILLIIPSYH